MTRAESKIGARIAALLMLIGCGAGLTQARATELRQQLRAAMLEPVASVAERDRHSRVLSDAVGEGALQGLDHEQMRAALGPGDACRKDLCGKHGFSDADWYYEIGAAQGAGVKQLPVLIVGFDPQGRAARVWTLTTH